MALTNANKPGFHSLFKGIILPEKPQTGPQWSTIVISTPEPITAGRELIKQCGLQKGHPSPGTCHMVYEGQRRRDFPKKTSRGHRGQRGKGSLLEDSTSEDRYLPLKKDVRVISGGV